MPRNDPYDLYFQWVTFDEAMDAGMADMLALHWEEVALDRGTVPYAPDLPKYRQLERAGVLRTVGAFRTGKLIGYDTFFVQPTLHHSTSLWAVNDLLYLEPEERRGAAGIRLILAAEQMLKALGVQRITYQPNIVAHFGHGKARGTVGDLLAKLDYRHVENVYAKML